VKLVGLVIVTMIGPPMISPPPWMSAHVSVIVKIVSLRVTLLIVHVTCELPKHELRPQ